MKGLDIGVLVADDAYRGALIKGLSHELNGAVFRTVGSEREADQADVLLTDRDVPEGNGRGTPSGAGRSRNNDTKEHVGGTGGIFGRREVLRLTYRDTDYDDGSPGEVFRYEDARIIAERIASAADGCRRAGKDGARTRIAVFLSTEGGSGVTSAALSFCRAAASGYGLRVLYWNLCPGDGAGKFLKTDGKGNMVSLIYHIRKGDLPDPGRYIRTLGGTDVLGAGGLGSVAGVITEEDVDAIVSAVRSTGRYDLIAADLGNHMAPGSERLLGTSDVAVLIKCGLPVRAEELADLMKRKKTGKTVCVRNKCGADETAGDEGFDVSDLRIGYDQDAFVPAGGRFAIETRGAYGKDIERLAEIIMEKLDGR